jgi:hypothetical protein
MVAGRGAKGEMTARQFLPAALEILDTPASPVGRMIGATIILFFAIAVMWSIFGYVDISQRHRARSLRPGAPRPSSRSKPELSRRSTLLDRSIDRKPNTA